MHSIGYLIKGKEIIVSNLTHIFSIGQKVKCLMDGKMYNGIVRETYENHIIVDVKGISDHCWFERGFNLDCVYPDYN